MIIIRTVCDNCGEILVKSNDIHLYLNNDDSAQNYFEFQCPRCGLLGTGEADKQFVKVLLENGVKPDVHKNVKTLPGKPLTWDDFLDFKLELRKSLFYKELSNLSKHSC